MQFACRKSGSLVLYAQESLLVSSTHCRGRSCWVPGAGLSRCKQAGCCLADDTLCRCGTKSGEICPVFHSGNLILRRENPRSAIANYSQSRIASSISRIGRPSRTGYDFLHAWQCSAWPLISSVSGPRQAGHARISSSSGEITRGIVRPVVLSNSTAVPDRLFAIEFL